jgi:hypothetical protein
MLDRETILKAPQRLSDLLAERNVTGEVCLLGGTAPDIALLARKLRLTSIAQALDVVAKYYPQSQIPVRTQYLLEDVFAQINRPDAPS